MTEAVTRPTGDQQVTGTRLEPDLELVGNYEGSARAIKRVRRFILDKQAREPDAD